MSARVTWAKGGEASIVSIGADTIVLKSTVPAPPGSRIDGTVGASAGDDGGTAIRVKVYASKREGEGEFVLQGRPLDMTRAVRERLEALVRAEDK
jgi:hypothetical protein